MGDLKPGWRRVRFGEVASHIAERAEPTNEGNVTYVGLEHLDSGSLTVRRWGSPTALVGTKLRMRQGDVLFARRNAYLRRVAIAPHNGLFSAHGMVLRPKGQHIHPDFLPFFMQSDVFMDRAEKISVGSLSPTINWSALKEEVFALPPQSEQRRLLVLLTAMSGLEEQLRDASIAARKVALSGSVVALGVDAGRRTAGLLDSIRVSPGWSIVQLRELASPGEQPVQVGPFGGTLASRHFAVSGVEVLKVLNVGHDGFVDRSDFVYVTERYAADLGRYRVRTSDVVVVAQGFTSGRVAIICEQDAGALISQHLIRVRLDSETNPSALALVLHAICTIRGTGCTGHDEDDPPWAEY